MAKHIDRSNERVVIDSLEAWKRCDAEAMAAARSEDCLSFYNVDGFSGPAGTAINKADAITRLIRLHQTYDWHTYDYKILEAANGIVRVGAFYVCACRTTGEETSGPIFITYTLRDGLIVRVEHEHDKRHREAFVRLTSKASASGSRLGISKGPLQRWFGRGRDVGVGVDPMVVAQAHFDAVSRCDLDEVAAWCDPAALFCDVLLRSTSAAEPAMTLGVALDRIRRFHAAYHVDHVVIRSRNVVGGDTVHLMFHSTVRHRALNAEFEGEIRCRYTIRNDRIWRLECTRDVPMIKAWQRMMSAQAMR
jgi:ketosteroid isomerase-like protein